MEITYNIPFGNLGGKDKHPTIEIVLRTNGQCQVNVREWAGNIDEDDELELKEVDMMWSNTVYGRTEACVVAIKDFMKEHTPLLERINKAQQRWKSEPNAELTQPERNDRSQFEKAVNQLEWSLDLDRPPPQHPKMEDFTMTTKKANTTKKPVAKKTAAVKKAMAVKKTAAVKKVAAKPAVKKATAAAKRGPVAQRNWTSMTAREKHIVRSLAAGPKSLKQLITLHKGTDIVIMPVLEALAKSSVIIVGGVGAEAKYELTSLGLRISKAHEGKAITKVDFTTKDWFVPGKRSKMTGKHIYKLSKTNPRRAGTFGHKSWECIKDGMSFEDYLRAGGRNKDLAWDITKGYVELKAN